MKTLIKPNLDKTGAAHCCMRAADMLLDIANRRGQSVEILLDEEDRATLKNRDDVTYGSYGEMLKECDIIISVGGDGTIMRAAQTAAAEKKPILGINAGHMGFLTQAEMHELGELERLFSGEYTVMDRMMLEAQVENGDKNTRHLALNDVVIRHGDSDRIASLEVRQDGRFVASHRADGVIFSTPTGSTAYSLSAGGPIVSPELELIVMTAICPHSAFNCSLVLPTGPLYSVRQYRSDGCKGMYVSIDGVRVGKLKQEGVVIIRRADIAAKFIDLGTREFFSNLNQKLSWRR